MNTQQLIDKWEEKKNKAKSDFENWDSPNKKAIKDIVYGRIEIFLEIIDDLKKLNEAALSEASKCDVCGLDKVCENGICDGCKALSSTA